MNEVKPKYTIKKNWSRKEIIKRLDVRYNHKPYSITVRKNNSQSHFINTHLTIFYTITKLIKTLALWSPHNTKPLPERTNLGTSWVKLNHSKISNLLITAIISKIEHTIERGVNVTAQLQGQNVARPNPKNRIS